MGHLLLCVLDHLGYPRIGSALGAALNMAVAAGVVSHPPTEQVVHRGPEDLAPQVPQRQVDGGDGRRVDVAAPKELTAPKRLPDVLDPRRVHPYEDGAVGVDQGLDSQLFPGDTRLPEPGQALVGVDFDEGIVALGTFLVMDEERLDVGDLHRGAPSLPYCDRC